MSQVLKNQDKIDSWKNKLSIDLENIFYKRKNARIELYNIQEKLPKNDALAIKRYQITILDYIRRTPAKVIKINLEQNKKTLCLRCQKIFPWGEPCTDDLYNFIWCEMVSECVR